MLNKGKGHKYYILSELNIHSHCQVPWGIFLIYSLHTDPLNWPKTISALMFVCVSQTRKCIHKILLSDIHCQIESSESSTKLCVENSIWWRRIALHIESVCWGIFVISQCFRKVGGHSLTHHTLWRMLQYLQLVGVFFSEQMNKENKKRTKCTYLCCICWTRMWKWDASSKKIHF